MFNKFPKNLAALLVVTVLTGGIHVEAKETSINSNSANVQAENTQVYETIEEIIPSEEEQLAIYTDEEPLSFDEAVKVYRDHLEKRDVKFMLHIDMPYYSSLATDIMNAATDVTKETKPTQGDYIRANTTVYKYSIYQSLPTTLFGYTITYIADAEQEKQVDVAVKNILDELDVYDADEYTKIKAVYHWITNNVKYDQSETKYSTYNALVEKKVVCQGYASAMYRLLKELDVEVRYITGSVYAGPHAWNIAKIGDVWYNLDPTWDAGNYIAGQTNYFLIGQTNFRGHNRYKGYDTEEFHEKHPMAKDSYDVNEQLNLSQKETTLEKGNKVALEVTKGKQTLPQNDFIWVSSDSNVTTVDQNGIVTAVGEGKAVITVKTKEGAYPASCDVTVKGVSVQSIKLSRTALTLKKGSKETIRATISPSNAQTSQIKFTSTNPKIVKVNEKTGVITAMEKGTADIIATTQDGTVSASCRVSVRVPVQSVKLSKTKVTMEKGSTTTLKATISPSDVSQRAISFSSSNEKVAKVNYSTGVVTAVANGTATITVKTKDGGKLATCNVTVKTSVKSVTFSKKTVNMKKGKTSEMKVTCTPSTASNKKVTYKTSDKSIATVSSKGVVKGLKKGKAKITVISEDGKKTATCWVVVG